MNELMNKKILIVDDEKALLKTVSDALFKEGSSISMRRRAARRHCPWRRASLSR